MFLVKLSCIDGYRIKIMQMLSIIEEMCQDELICNRTDQHPVI